MAEHLGLLASTGVAMKALPSVAITARVAKIVRVDFIMMFVLVAAPTFGYANFARLVPVHETYVNQRLTFAVRV